MKALVPLIFMFACSLGYADISADNSAAQVEQLQRQWALIKYQQPEKQREDALEKLAQQAKTWRQADPENPELLTWEGIILSTLAGEAGGLSALGKVADARELFEKAIEINDKALDGSAYTSLGVLYYQVPGWPLSFGNDKKARILLEKGLAENPDGIDSNYFYGEFLLEQDQPEHARTVLEHALQAPARPARPIADEGRREEIKQLMATIKAEK